MFSKGSATRLPAPGNHFDSIAAFEQTCINASLATSGINLHRQGSADSLKKIRVCCSYRNQYNTAASCKFAIAASVVEGESGWTIDDSKSVWGHTAQQPPASKRKRRRVVESLSEGSSVEEESDTFDEGERKTEDGIPLKDFKMPQVGDVFPSRRAALIAASYVWHSRGYRTVNSQGPSHSHVARYIFGCTLHVPVKRPDACPAKIYLKPVVEDEWDRPWRVHTSHEEHNHHPEDGMGIWGPPRKGAARTESKWVKRTARKLETRGARICSGSDSSDDDKGPTRGSKQVVVQCKQTMLRAHSRQSTSTSSARLPPSRQSTSTTPAQPTTSSGLLSSSIRSSPSLPLSLAFLASLLNSLSPSLGTLAPLLHQHGLRSTNGVLAVLCLPELTLMGALEEIGVSPVARRILGTKVGEVGEGFA